MFVDSHCHLEGPKYSADRAEVITRAAKARVAYLLAIGNGNGPEEADCGIRLAEEFGGGGAADASNSASGHELADGQESPAAPAIYATVGVHPHEAKLAKADNLSQLEKWARHPKVIGWGEIGLDYWYDFSPRAVQRRVFLQQLEMAKAAKKPVIIHCRSSKDSWDAWDECLQFLAEHWGSTGLGGIMHCFSGTTLHAKKALALGFMLSFAGNITFPKADDIRETAKMAPMDRVLVETDSPYLAPVPYRGRRNEPAYVTEVARHIGDLRMMLTEEVGAQTTQNFLRFFNLQ